MPTLCRPSPPPPLLRRQRAVLAPLQAEREAARRDRAAKAAATKVDFFTMVRGED